MTRRERHRGVFWTFEHFRANGINNCNGCGALCAIPCGVTDVKNDVLRTDISTRKACFACADDDNRAIVRRKIVEDDGRNILSAQRVEVARNGCLADRMRFDCIAPIDRAIGTVQNLSR